MKILRQLTVLDILVTPAIILLVEADKVPRVVALMSVPGP